jgi:hypothetical protein
VPATTVAFALPYVNWILLVALSAGSLVFVVVTGRLTDATSGYLRFTAVCAAALAGLAWVADGALPAATDALAIRAAPAPFDLLRPLALAGMGVTGMAYAVVAKDERRRFAAGLVGVGAASITLAAAAFGWAPTIADGVPLLLQLALLALASGGTLAGLVLGHWYLVTPRISERPLLLQTRLLTGVIALQLAAFATWALFGGGPGQAQFEVLLGDAAFLGWLRLIVSLIFPLALAWMAWATARTRSMESATGLLYICVAAVAAGTIGAAALYVGAGLLV